MPSKIHFKKEYERDVSLIIEGLWSTGLFNLIQKRLHIESHYKVMCAFYATRESLEIWENKKGIQWFRDTLLEINKKSPKFMLEVVEEYKEVLAKIEEFWNTGPTTDKEKINEYMKYSVPATELFSLWYYPVSDERTPKEINEILMPLREKDEFFARNDIYIKECVKALGGDTRLANLIFPNEFPHIPSREILEERAKGTLLIGDEIVTIPLKEYAKMHPEYEFEGLFETIEKTDTMKGQIAQKGRVSGRVRIVKNKFQMEGVEEGDIIVSPMTTPDFIPAMKKAAAFVTDEGGIICHAAIVAREMKKPCIIGTKIATQILKNGDMIEVDADNGMVRKLG